MDGQVRTWVKAVQVRDPQVQSSIPFFPPFLPPPTHPPSNEGHAPELSSRASRMQSKPAVCKDEEGKL